MKVLVINAGSSSLKYQLFDMDNEYVMAKGNCQKIGIAGSFITHKYANESVKLDIVLENHNQAMEKVLELLTSDEYGVIKNLNEISAVGHRVLHGGEIYKDSVIVTPSVLKNLEDLKPLGPLHMPANISGILACQKVLPSAPQVAVFDTAFHSQMPKEAFLYAVPYEAYEDWRIRRYGFHGTSHKFVSGEAARILGLSKEEALQNLSSMTYVKTVKIQWEE